MAKTAVRSVRGESQKRFAAIFDSLTGARSRWEIWADFVTMAALEVSNLLDRDNAPERIKTYQTIASKYKEPELQKFAEMLVELINGMEANPDQDYLGELYMNLDLGNEHAGQFFTPYHVCKMMSAMTFGDDLIAKIKREHCISVNDPACGAGALLVSFANECLRHDVNYQTKVLFIAQDIDYIVGMMCYLQLSFMGCAGYVVIGDTLAHPSTSYDPKGLFPRDGQNVWYTPFYFLEEWHIRGLYTMMGMPLGGHPKETAQEALPAELPPDHNSTQAEPEKPIAPVATAPVEQEILTETTTGQLTFF